MGTSRQVKIDRVETLEDLDTLSGVVEVEVEGRIRPMAYHGSTRSFEGTKRILFSRTENSNYVCQFIVADGQIEVTDGKLKLSKPYEKDMSRSPNGGFYILNKTLEGLGL